jgi:hypothetical protein
MPAGRLKYDDEPVADVDDVRLVSIEEGHMSYSMSLFCSL